MIINDLIRELCESVSVKKIPQYIPKEKWSAAFENIIKRHGRSNFRSLTISDMFKTPSEGWFFHYSKYHKKYFEGQYSFQFVYGFIFDDDIGINNISFEDGISWNNGNFLVDSIKKQIIIEKAWSGERLLSGHIEDLESVKDALYIAVRHHPEIIDYKFNYSRMGFKKVSDVLNASSVGEEEGNVVLFWGTSEDALRMANKDKYEDIVCWFDSKLAKGEIKAHKHNNPIELGSAVVKLGFKSNDKRLKKLHDGSISVTRVSKNDIISYNASKDFNINEEILYKKYKKYKFLDSLSIYVSDNIEKLKSKYNLNPLKYIYERRGDRWFFVADSKISDEKIVFSLLSRVPDLFELNFLGIVDYYGDKNEYKEIISDFILNKNIHTVLKLFFDNLFFDRYNGRIKDVKLFIDIVAEFFDI